MNIRIVTTYKKDKSFVKKGLKEYTKRLSRYCTLSFERIKRPEELKRMIKDKDTLILVDFKGELISSEYLAEYILHLGVKGKSDLLFILAPEEIPEQKVDLHISLTTMEMDIQLMTLTLIEQIYRAFSINHHLPYHK